MECEEGDRIDEVGVAWSSTEKLMGAVRDVIEVCEGGEVEVSPHLLRMSR